MSTIFEASKLRDDVLPTELDIYKHYLYLSSVKGAAGDWKQNTSISTKVQCVRDDVAVLWNRSGIPHDCGGRLGEKRVMNLVNKCKAMNKVAIERRHEKFGDELNVLFDAAICKHFDFESCSCEIQDKVPLTWRVFLDDQRGPRALQGVLSTRTLTLRTAKHKDREDQEATEVLRYRVEELGREERDRNERKRKSQEDIDTLLNRVPIQSEDIQEGVSESDIVESDPSDESDWEDLEEDEQVVRKSRIYNTLPLKNFARECDRYGVSDRAGAKIGNGLMKDLGIVDKDNMDKLICPNRLRRERRKWGAKLEEEKDQVVHPHGVYTDGKKVPTLVRKTALTKVQVPGGRGRGAYRTVITTSNKLVVEDHYPVLAEPGGDYVTHMTPENGTGLALANEIVSVVKERSIDIKVLGCDGCSVNTGKNIGAIRLVEILLGKVVQHCVCGLHLNELLFWHILSDSDSVTKGPDSLSGPTGSTLHLNIWEEPVVTFLALEGKVLELPAEVVKDLSRDQHLGYRYAHAIQSGKMPDDLVSQVIGPLVSSRWNTTANRVMCKYTRTRKPTKGLIRLTQVVLNLYYPGWFQYKCYPHIQDGARNYFFLLELTKDLKEKDKLIAQKVLQDNAHWPHSENILISMLADQREEVRRRAVLLIMKARREFKIEEHPRQFTKPEVNFKAANYFDMIDFEVEPCTEPPLTMDMDLDTIMGAFREPLILPPYPSNTQGVERMVRVVTEVASKKAGFTARHRMILQLLQSRNMVPRFNTKSDDAIV